MSFKCLNCGHIFDECEVAEVKEVFGNVGVCPLCKGSFEETVRCSICKGEFLEDELYGGVCKECIDQHRHDTQKCMELSKGEYQRIKINYLIASLLSEEQINKILSDYVRQYMSSADCSKFIDEDISWFGEMLAKGGENK